MKRNDRRHHVMNASYVLLAVACSAVVASCSRKLPEEGNGTKPRVELRISAPTDAIQTTQTIKGSIAISAGRQKQNATIGMDAKLECKPLKSPADNHRGVAQCRVLKASYRLNNIEASSDDPLPEPKNNPSDPWPPFSHKNMPADPAEKARRELQRELRDLTKAVKVDLHYGPGLSKPEIKDIDSSLKNRFTILEQALEEYFVKPHSAVESFIASSARMLPERSVGQGAVWHVVTRNEYLPDMPVRTAVMLENLDTRGPDKIATLKSRGWVSIDEPTDIATPMGDRVRVTKCDLEITGKVVLNVTRQREERSEMTISGFYRVKQGGRTANCDMEITAESTREYRVSDKNSATQPREN